jgi:DNA adenine methylase
MIKKYNLSKTNEEGYKKFRDYYNLTKYSLDLFILVAYSFNHQIRLNNNHNYNNPFGRNRSSFNNSMKLNLKKFILELKSKNIEFQNLSFETFNFSKLTGDDFVYCDPPYLITTGSYNDGKRGFKGWTEKEEIELLTLLKFLNKKGIRFALSNVIYHKGKENIILKEWINNNNFNLNYLNKNYSNSNYQTKVREKKGSLDVLITNYIQPKLLQPKPFNF